jgi:GTP-binding protein
MLPVIAIVGRPNVGKSTLFNVLTRSRDALVADQPGLTRDRKFGRGQVNEQAFLVIDTGGLDEDKNAIVTHIGQQVDIALQEADAVLFLVDGRHGLTAADETIAQRLRQSNKPVYLVLNKTEYLNKPTISAEFYGLGFNPLFSISATHRHGVNDLLTTVLKAISPEQLAMRPELVAFHEETGIRIAIIGRPNVGKSTLVNRLLGYERVIAYDQPGTTRDSIAVPLERDGQRYTLIDTAGVRRRSKVHEVIEKFSVIKSLQSIDNADVVIMLMDAREGMTDQDASLLGEIIEHGRALVIAVNKWDGLTPYDRDQVRHSLERKLHFIDFAKIHFISALHGSGVGLLFDSIQQAWRAASQHIATSQLNQVLETLLISHPPPLVRGRRIKPRFMHQAGTCPPTFVLHGNQVNAMPDAYKRYLINSLRQAFKLEGTPLRLELKQGENPFAGRKNTLTPRQERQRKRLIKHVKKNKK